MSVSKLFYSNNGQKQHSILATGGFGYPEQRFF